MTISMYRRLAAVTAALAVFLLSAVPARAGLLALYSFNGTLNDTSGNGKNATDTGAASYADGAPFGGKAIRFDGSGNALVKVPLDIRVRALPQLTMGMWVRAAAFDNPQYGIASIDDGGFDRQLGIDTRGNESGATAWSAFVGGTAAGGIPVVAGKWVFVAVAYDQASLPGTYAFYVNDGNKTTVLTGPSAFDDDADGSVTIGKNPNYDQPFNGEVANAFFYQGILTREQIDAIVAKGPSAIPGNAQPAARR